MLTHLNTAVWLTVQHLETTLLVFIHSSFARLVEPLYGHVFQLKEVLQTPASSFLLRDSYRLPNYLHISVFIYLHYVTALLHLTAWVLGQKITVINVIISSWVTCSLTGIYPTEFMSSRVSCTRLVQTNYSHLQIFQYRHGINSMYAVVLTRSTYHQVSSKITSNSGWINPFPIHGNN